MTDHVKTRTRLQLIVGDWISAPSNYFDDDNDLLYILKENLRTWIETIELVDLGEKNCAMLLIKAIRQQSFIDGKVISVRKFH